MKILSKTKKKTQRRKKMSNIKVTFKHTRLFEKNVVKYTEEVAKIHKEFHEKAKSKKEFLGWLELPTNYDKKEFEKIKKSAEKIREDSDVLLVIGIGGSYLGARAVIEALTSNFHNMLEKEKRKSPQIIYVGNNLNASYINDVMEYIEGKDFSIM